jgi:hypothetical protein
LVPRAIDGDEVDDENNDFVHDCLFQFLNDVVIGALFISGCVCVCVCTQQQQQHHEPLTTTTTTTTTKRRSPYILHHSTLAIKNQDPQDNEFHH